MRKQLRFGKGFRVALTGSRAQAATMVLAPGDKEGGPDNYHRGSDQWLFVVAGTGNAVVGGRGMSMKTGTLLFIPKGARHEIRNTGRTPLKTLNLYNPPAYKPDGNPLPRGKGKAARKGQKVK
jgi:mannose-6-phosphate isomerase-like protein (cupin superfamily)